MAKKKTEFMDRLLSETPKFFKVVKKAAMYLGGSAIAVIAANESMSLDLSETVIQLCKYAIAVSVAIAGTAQLTRKQ